jgi:hypothetical protein
LSLDSNKLELLGATAVCHNLAVYTFILIAVCALTLLLHCVTILSIASFEDGWLVRVDD